RAAARRRRGRCWPRAGGPARAWPPAYARRSTPRRWRLTERRDPRAAAFPLAAQAIELVPVDRRHLRLGRVVAASAVVVPAASGGAACQPAGQRQQPDARTDEAGAARSVPGEGDQP